MSRRRKGRSPWASRGAASKTETSIRVKNSISNWQNSVPDVVEATSRHLQKPIASRDELRNTYKSVFSICRRLEGIPKERNLSLKLWYEDCYCCWIVVAHANAYHLLANYPEEGAYVQLGCAASQIMSPRSIAALIGVYTPRGLFSRLPQMTSFPSFRRRFSNGQDAAGCRHVGATEVDHRSESRHHLSPRIIPRGVRGHRGKIQIHLPSGCAPFPGRWSSHEDCSQGGQG